MMLVLRSRCVGAGLNRWRSNARSKRGARRSQRCSGLPHRNPDAAAPVDCSARAREVVAVPGRGACCSHHGGIGERGVRRSVEVPDDSFLYSTDRSRSHVQTHPQKKCVSQNENRRSVRSAIGTVDRRASAGPIGRRAGAVRSGLSRTCGQRSICVQHHLWLSVGSRTSRDFRSCMSATTRSKCPLKRRVPESERSTNGGKQNEAN